MAMLRWTVFIFMVLIAASGCSKRQEAATMTGLGIDAEDKDIVTETITSNELIEPQRQAQPPVALVEQPLVQPMQVEPPLRGERPSIPLGPEGAERNIQIQTALKNANLYFGEIDGKVGPLTRKAIEEFQKMKGLKVDGKVGPITWGELQKYLDVQPTGTKKVTSWTKIKR